jgi:hypothetical protein
MTRKTKSQKLAEELDALSAPGAKVVTVPADPERTASRASSSNELVTYKEPDPAVTMEQNKRLLQESQQIQNLERGMRALTTPTGATIDDFFYNPFGHGSLLEQAIWFIRDKAFHGQPNTLVNMSLMSRMLNEMIDREMRLMGIVIEERFVFESVNEFNAGGEMSVAAYDQHGRRLRTYSTWSI